MVERSLPTPEILGSNPDLGKKIYLPTVQLKKIEKTKIKKKRPGMAHHLEKS